MESDEDGGRQLDSDSVVPISQVQCNDDGESDTDQSLTLVQVAFLELMTRKVIEAAADCPDVLKLLNESVRKK